MAIFRIRQAVDTKPWPKFRIPGAARKEWYGRRARVKAAGIATSLLFASGLLIASCASAKHPPAPRPAPAPSSVVVVVDAGAPPPDEIATDELEPLLRNDSEIAALIDEGGRRRLQVLAAFPTRAKDGRLVLHRSALRLDAEYFYPASSVKLFAAYAAIEKLDDMSEELTVPVSTTTPIRFVTGEGRSRQVVTTTLRRDLEQALIVSDNDAHDRLFDFVGREELAERLAHIGLKRTILVQHLGKAAKARVATPPLIDLLVPPEPPVSVSHRLGFEVPTSPWAGVRLGRAYVDERGKVVQGPMDFSTKNATSLRDLQDVLIAITRPELFDRLPSGTLHSPAARPEVVEILAKLPSELEGSRRGRPTAKDAFQKPLQVGLTAAFPEEKVRVYGKGGRAYGFTVENAYIVSERTGRGFFLASTLYANDNDTLNDDGYEYLSVGTPFLARLGVILARKVFREAESPFTRPDAGR